MPLIFSCPEVSVPSDLPKNTIRRHAGAVNATKDFKTSTRLEKFNFAGDSNPATLNQKDIRDIFSEIKDFNSYSLTKGAKRKFMDDKLTKLGAPPPKQQKIPFKIKIGIISHAKRVSDKEIAKARESGVVLAKSKTNSRRETKKALKRSDDGAGGVDKVKVKAGVATLRNNMSLSKK